MQSQFTNTKIFCDFKKTFSIRITGSSEDVESVFVKINEFLNLFSNQIVTSGLELKTSEYTFLQSQKDKTNEIKKSEKIFIQKSVTKIFTLLSLNTTEIELCVGNFVNIPADAYVSLAKKDLKNGGIFKAIMDKAGKSIQIECDEHAKNRRSKIGDVLVTGSGNLGVKMNSIIIHAIGSIWQDGSSFESDNLALTIVNCLSEAEKRKSESIVIPLISTGTFNYSVNEVFETVSENVITYVLNNPQTKVKKIIFNTDDDSIATTWTDVLKYKANMRNIRIQSKKSPSVSAWYWKNDEGHWKAFIYDLNEILETKFNQKVSSFDMKIGNQRYSIDFSKMTQTNKVSGYVREITNKVSMVSKNQWSFENDEKQIWPLSENQSQEIEEAYKSKKDFIDIELRRHDNGNFEVYRYQFFKNNQEPISSRCFFCLNSNDESESIGKQINKRTGFKRNIFRITVKADIIEDEKIEEETNEVVKIFISGMETNVNSAVNDLKKLIEEAYISETFPLIEISETELKRLEREYSAFIKSTNQNITVKALPDDINKIKTELNIYFQNIAVSYPKIWAVMVKNDKFKTIEIMRNSNEFNDIFIEVSKSVLNPQIKKIERIQNALLWDKYESTTKFLDGKGTKKNEKWLFHGTGSTGK